MGTSIRREACSAGPPYRCGHSLQSRFAGPEYEPRRMDDILETHGTPSGFEIHNPVSAGGDRSRIAAVEQHRVLEGPRLRGSKRSSATTGFLSFPIPGCCIRQLSMVLRP